MAFIILDRDGVINYESDSYIKSPDEWLPIPGSLKAIADLNASGFNVLIATNQSGIARGLYDAQVLDLIHKKLMEELALVGGYITEIFYCPHHPYDQCRCRKPKPGLLLQMSKKYPINLSETYFIGDSLRDIEAGQQAGCKPMLVLTGNGRQVIAEHPHLKSIPHFLDLASAVEYVLSNKRKS